MCRWGCERLCKAVGYSSPLRVSRHHPVGLRAQERLPLLKMTEKILFLIKELFPLICTGVFIN